MKILWGNMIFFFLLLRRAHHHLPLPTIACSPVVINTTELFFFSRSICTRVAGEVSGHLLWLFCLLLSMLRCGVGCVGCRGRGQVGPCGNKQSREKNWVINIFCRLDNLGIRIYGRVSGWLILGFILRFGVSVEMLRMDAGHNGSTVTIHGCMKTMSRRRYVLIVNPG